jgi:vitamin B12 transporter
VDPGIRLVRRAGALVLLSALAAPAARAEEPPPEPVVMDEVVVRLPRGEISQAPAAAATVVDADRFAGEAKGVAELVAVSPGVDVQRYGAAGQLATVAIRGVAADGVKVLVDGLPLGGAAGYVDLSTIPRAWIRRVQVVRGPEGAAFGSGALGGAVNILTRTDPGVAAEASAGSFGTYQLAGSGATRVGSFTALAGVSAETTRGDFPYRHDPTPDDPHPHPVLHLTAANDDSQRAGALLKLGGPVGDRSRIDAFLQVSGGHRGLPGPAANPTPANWQDDGRVLAMVRQAWDPTEGLTLSARVHGRGDLLDTRIAGLGSEPTRQRGGAGGIQLEADLHGGAARLGALASAEVEGFSGTALGGSRSRATLAAALSGDLTVGRLSGGPAVRVERTGPYTGVSGSLGARLALPADLRLRASAGRTYRVPSFTELYLRQGGLEPNPGLRPARGLGADAALVYDGPAGLFSAGGFAEREDDIISYEPSSLDRFKAQNTQSALLRGLELEAATARARALWNLSAQAACTFLHSEVLAGPPGLLGKDLPRRPREQLFARLAVEPSPLEAHVEVRRVRTQFQDRFDVKRLPDATTFGAGGSVRVWERPRVALHLQVDNLTDRRDLLDGFGNPLPGRSVMVTVRAGSSEPGEP